MLYNMLLHMWNTGDDRNYLRILSEKYALIQGRAFVIVLTEADLPGFDRLS